MRKIVSVDVLNDREEFIGVSEDGLLWHGKLKELNREQVKEIGNSVRLGDRWIEWTALNRPKDGEVPWNKKLPFWDAMELYYGDE